jgi:glycogen synthase
VRDRLRVAVVSRAVHPLHGFGGLERHVADLVRHLANRAVDVTLITRHPDSPLDAETAAKQVGEGAPLSVRFVPYTTFPFAGRRGTTVIDRSTAYPLFGLRAGREAARLASAGAVDVVHGLGASVLGYALSASRLRARVPLVLNPQGLEEFGGTGRRFAGGRLKQVGYAPLRAAVRLCARRAASVIATDRSIEPSVERYLRVPRSRIDLVPNAVDLDRCDSLAGPADGHHMRRFVPSGAEYVLLSVGRIERNKGFQVMADALGRLRDRSWCWILIGDGPYKSDLQAQLQALRLTDRVRLMGPATHQELHAWYECADVFVHPTLYEGSSLVTLEAMAHRRPVVATTAGGLPDKVHPGVTGWLVPPGDADALAGSLGEAMAHRDHLSALGVAGRSLVERMFSWNAVAGLTIDLYRRLLGWDWTAPRGRP